MAFGKLPHGAGHGRGRAGGPPLALYCAAFVCRHRGKGPGLFGGRARKAQNGRPQRVCLCAARGRAHALFRRRRAPENKRPAHAGSHPPRGRGRLHHCHHALFRRHAAGHGRACARLWRRGGAGAAEGARGNHAGGGAAGCGTWLSLPPKRWQSPWGCSSAPCGATCRPPLCIWHTGCAT